MEDGIITGIRILCSRTKVKATKECGEWNRNVDQNNTIEVMSVKYSSLAIRFVT